MCGPLRQSATEEPAQEDVKIEDPDLNHVAAPIIGEKRPREEEDHEPQEAAQAIPTVPDSNPMASGSANGNRNYTMGGGNQVKVEMGQPGNDALYIGDLQWVRSSCRQTCHVPSSEMLPVSSLFTVDH